MGGGEGNAWAIFLRFSTSQTADAQRAAEIETHLKAIGLSNQTERKRLAAAHATLSKEHSQEEVTKGSQSIRLQLINLASKQKQLLQCFVKQKEITSQLSKMVQHSQLSTGAVPTSSNVNLPVVARSQQHSQLSTGTVPTSSSVNLPVVARSQQHSQLSTGTVPTSSSVNLPVVARSQQHSQLSTGTVPTSSSVNLPVVARSQQHSQLSTGTVPTSSNVNLPQVALPNLVKHLKSAPSKNASPCQQYESMQVATQPTAQQHPATENCSQTSAITTTAMATEPSAQKPPSDLAQSVPLDVLIKHKIIQPEAGYLTCTLMVCMCVCLYVCLFVGSY